MVPESVILQVYVFHIIYLFGVYYAGGEDGVVRDSQCTFQVTRGFEEDKKSSCL